MQPVFSEALLAQLRTLRGDDGVRGDDPDDSIDPDDSSPRLVVTLEQSPDGEPCALLQEPLEPEQTSGRCPHTPEGSNAPQPPLQAPAAAAGAPAPPDLLDPAVLRTMPPQVAAFMLYEPREPPPWRRQETLSERARRGLIEDCGAWVGE
jgi:hypothetical protein